LINLIVATLES